MTTLKIIFFGTSDFGIPSLEALYSSKLLSAVVTTPDKPGGRQLKLQESPVKQWARAHELTCHDYSREDPLALLPLLKELRPDLFVVISFGAILKSDYLTAPRLYSLNVHASLLPKYRGASPMQYALMNGDKETGVSVMRMIERLDAGDVLLQKKLLIGSDEDLMGLKERLSALAVEALIETINGIERGNVRLTVQNEAETSYAHKISKNDGRIDWGFTAPRLSDRIRAFSGWPGSFFFFKGKRVVVGKARVLPQGSGAAPGTVMDASSADGLRVATGDSGCLSLEQLQLEGKKMLLYKEFAKGFALKAGDVLE